MVADVLMADLDLLLGHAGSRFVPRPEERLLLVVHALLHRCYKLPFSNSSPVRRPPAKELRGHMQGLPRPCEILTHGWDLQDCSCVVAA
jgi:hypothetical protein